MAFFLESTFVGLFFLGWDRLSKGQHFMVTVLTAIGSKVRILPFVKGFSTTRLVAKIRKVGC